MPSDPRDQEAEARQECDPKEPAPVAGMPPTLAESPPCDAEVHNVRDEEGSEECADDLLLQHGVCEEVLAGGAEDEEVDEAEKAYYMSEL